MSNHTSLPNSLIQPDLSHIIRQEQFLVNLVANHEVIHGKSGLSLLRQALEPALPSWWAANASVSEHRRKCTACSKFTDVVGVGYRWFILASGKLKEMASNLIAMASNLIEHSEKLSHKNSASNIHSEPS